LFSLLRASAALGQVFSSADDVVVLSHRLWQRRFGGDPGIVGQSLTLDGKPYAVAGVMPPGFEFPPFWATGAEMWTPLRLTGEDESNHSRFLRVFARRRPGVTLASARAEMEVIGQRLAAQDPAENAGIAVNVEALQEPVVSEVRPALWMLMGAVGLVLLIACANVTSLLLAQGLGRERELALRIALGADRGDILRELLTDSIVLSVTGGLAGLGLAKLGIELLRAWSPPGFPRLDEIGLDGRVVAFNLLLSLGAGLLSGLVPALRASRGELTGALRQGDRVVRPGGAQRIHDALVVVEFALALVLLVGAGLLTRSFLQLMSPRPGFDTTNLLTLSVSFSSSPFREAERQPLFLDDLLGRVRSVPGVEAAALVNHLPISGDTWSLSFTVEGQPQAANDPPSAVFRVATPDYLKTMGIGLVHGRSFTADDRADTPGVVIVNRTLARRFWGEADPVGSRIKQGAQDSSQPWLTVVGVTEDARQSSLVDAIRPEVLFPYTQNPVAWFRSTTLVVRTAVEPLSLVEPLKAGIWSLDPDLPLTGIQSMAEVLRAAVGQERFNTSLLGAFALTAVFLAVLGMYGVMAYAVTRRRHEIGVRMALGADASRVFAGVVGRALVLSLLGAALGLACAQALSGILGRLLVGVSPHDPVAIACATALLLATSLLASAIPASRAAQVDPLVVLREE
jgi:putative ABC transport system permease protein